VIRGIGHIAFRVADMERSLAYYRGVLGLEELTRLTREDGSLWLVYLRASDDTIIELFPEGDPAEGPGPRAVGYAHFSLTVDDMHRTLAELRARGLAESGEPRRGTDGNLGFWITDPDGTRIELMELAPDGLQMRALRASKERRG
jgi:lactoylglutathione lyase